MAASFPMAERSWPLPIMPVGHAAVGSDGSAGNLRHDPRFDRAWRGWPDASADRTSGNASGDARINVFRPADIIELPDAGTGTAGRGRAVVLVLSRQELPMLRHAPAMTTDQAAVLMCCAKPRKAATITILATGSEVSIACTAAESSRQRTRSRCRCLHAVLGVVPPQTPAYRRPVLGSARVSASRPQSGRLGALDRRRGAFIGMQGFGASAPAADLYRHFGITAENIVAPPRVALPERG